MASSKLNFMMYAYDTTLYFNLEDLDCRNLDNVINSEIEKINLWLKLNKLSINADKAKYIIKWIMSLVNCSGPTYHIFN